MHMHHLHTHIHIRLHLYRQRVPQRYAAHAFKVDATDGSSHLLLQVMENIIPARDPKQCQNKNNEGSWYHGPIITHIAPHLSSVLGPDAAEHRKVRKLPRKIEHQFLGQMFVINELLMRIITHHTSYTYLHIYTSQQHISTHHWAKTFSGRKVLDRRTPKGTRSENSTSVLGPDVSERVVIARTSTCLLSCRLKVRDTTDQNIVVSSALLMRIITHHTSYTYTHLKHHHTTTPPHHHKVAKHRKVRVLGPAVDTSTKTPPQKHHHITTSAQSCKTPKSTSSPAGCWHHHTTTTKTPPHHHISTILQNTEKHEFSGRMLTPPHHHHKNTTTPPPRQRTSVLGPDGAEHRKVRKLPRKMNISSWAGCCRTPKSTKITTKNEHQFLGRMLQNTEKYENYHEKWTSVLGPDVAEHRKARKLPRKLDFSSWAGCCSAKNVKKARVLL